MTTRTLTGRTRFREHKRWGKPSLLVLQVQERVTGVPTSSATESCEYLEFRDISITDLKSPLELSAVTAVVTADGLPPITLL